MPEITEADRAAAVVVMMGNRDAKDAVLAGQNDNWIVQAFAAHREATEAAIVARAYTWLGFWRDQMPGEAVEQLQQMLGSLAAGAHRG